MPVFWPGESHGLYSPWGSKELVVKNFHLLLKYTNMALAQFQLDLLYKSIKLITDSYRYKQGYTSKALNIFFPFEAIFPVLDICHKIFHRCVKRYMYMDARYDK